MVALRERTVHPDAEVRFLARCAYHGQSPATTHESVGGVSASQLEEGLADPSAERRWWAARGCSRGGSAAHARVAIDRIWRERDAWVRAELVRVIGLAGPGAGNIVSGLLADPDERVRSNALEVLVDIGHRPQDRDIEVFAEAPHHRARAAALVALAKLAGADVRGAAWQMMISKKPWLRASGRYVARALRPLWQTWSFNGTAPGIAPSLT
jgi:hypothetical protein